MEKQTLRNFCAAAGLLAGIACLTPLQVHILYKILCYVVPRIPCAAKDLINENVGIALSARAAFYCDNVHIMPPPSPPVRRIIHFVYSWRISAHFAACSPKNNSVFSISFAVSPVKSAGRYCLKQTAALYRRINPQRHGTAFNCICRPAAVFARKKAPGTVHSGRFGCKRIRTPAYPAEQRDISGKNKGKRCRCFRENT